MDQKQDHADRNHQTIAMQGQQAEHLPSTLKEAIDYFEESTWVKDVLGEEFCKQYVAAQEK